MGFGTSSDSSHLWWSAGLRFNPPQHSQPHLYGWLSLCFSVQRSHSGSLQRFSLRSEVHLGGRKMKRSCRQGRSLWLFLTLLPTYQVYMWALNIFSRIRTTSTNIHVSHKWASHAFALRNWFRYVVVWCLENAARVTREGLHKSLLLVLSRLVLPQSGLDSPSTSSCSLDSFLWFSFFCFLTCQCRMSWTYFSSVCIVQCPLQTFRGTICDNWREFGCLNNLVFVVVVVVRRLWVYKKALY